MGSMRTESVSDCFFWQKHIFKNQSEGLSVGQNMLRWQSHASHCFPPFQIHVINIVHQKIWLCTFPTTLPQLSTWAVGWSKRWTLCPPPQFSSPDFGNVHIFKKHVYSDGHGWQWGMNTSKTLNLETALRAHLSRWFCVSVKWRRVSACKARWKENSNSFKY